MNQDLKRRANDNSLNLKKNKKKRRIEKTLPPKIESLIPESKLYTQLHEFEKKMDATIMRKRLDIQEAMSKPIKTKKTLRIFVSNTTSEQNKNIMNINDISLDNISTPSWILKIEGKLLDNSPGKKNMIIDKKFSSFVKRVIVELDRDQTLYPEGNIIEWNKEHGTPEIDGFEIKRTGDTDVNARILIEMDYAPHKYKLSEDLSKLLNIKLDTKTNIIMALWQYIKYHKLQDSDDKRIINNDEELKKIFKVNQITFPQMPELINYHLLPPDPIVIDYKIKVGERQIDEAEYAYDVEVEVDDSIRNRISSVVSVLQENTKEYMDMDEKISKIIQAINNCKLKRDFMMSFVNDPVTFINQWVASQARDYEVILGESHINKEESRHSEFFKKPWIKEAIFHYLNAKTHEKYNELVNQQQH
ncbi:SWI/SNF and RSC complex subunit Ssr3 [Piromyces finnis]|uniref:SWI/SNF and RSC complex subunit Ssr3 n=1 Tax=Piromyces finnis TaxID=1754191 RepID=A0A1Y1VJ46_9FUNG|nr:SWI/SNF and RSC complex subunit Ssr3 [Piromyces finnis]|eukprot:ORX56122.1 SWI/SNF and RSC complex subunit Ssr3 [Piromyces finnis]